MQFLIASEVDGGPQADVHLILFSNFFIFVLVEIELSQFSCSFSRNVAKNHLICTGNCLLNVIPKLWFYNFLLDFKKELRSLNRELQLHLLELADVLVERPSQYARRVEDISLIFKNLHHLLNSLRPHQVKYSSCRNSAWIKNSLWE